MGAASPSKDGDGAAEESIESIVNFIQEGNSSVPQKVIFLRLLYPPLCFRLSCCIASKQSVSISTSIQTASQNALRIGTAQELPISQEITVGVGSGFSRLFDISGVIICLRV